MGVNYIQPANKFPIYSWLNLRALLSLTSYKWFLFSSYCWSSLEMAISLWPYEARLQVKYQLLKSTMSGIWDHPPKLKFLTTIRITKASVKLFTVLLLMSSTIRHKSCQALRSKVPELNCLSSPWCWNCPPRAIFESERKNRRCSML